MSIFLDTEFMTAKEKELVLKGWKTFIKGGFQRKHFTKRIYDHLSQHCSFIAHYNIHGFYDTYFENPEDTIKFISQFDRDKGCRSVEYGWDLWISGEYGDINQAMCDAIEPYKAAIYEKCHQQGKERDLAMAHTLAKKHGMKLNEAA